MPRYPSLLHFSNAWDSWKNSTSQRKAMCGIIRILVLNCAPLLVSSKDDGKTAVETASDEMVMGVFQALYEFFLLVSQQNLSYLSLRALDDTLKRFYLMNGMLRDQKMLKSANAQLSNLLAMGFHQLCKQRTYKICSAIEALVYVAEKVSTTKCRQFQVCMNWARQVVTI